MVGKIVHALKMGCVKPRQPDKDSEDEDDDDERTKYFNLWSNDDKNEINKRINQHIPAPKPRLPGHAESYNPPREYLFTAKEESDWLNKQPEKRRQNFIPQRYEAMRKIAAYPRFINERFERCLDLYLCPRKRKIRMNVDPQDLIPNMPKPRDLMPFPTAQSLLFRGHTAAVRCISVSPGGQWLVSGSDDGSVRFWEVTTARCLKTIVLCTDTGKDSKCIKSICWNPNPSLSLVAVAMNHQVIVINPMIGDKIITANTDTVLTSASTVETDTSDKVSWNFSESDDRKLGIRIRLQHPKPVNQVTWHNMGDYISVVLATTEYYSVMIHQLSRQRTQIPFKKSKGLVQKVMFHPIRPIFFVATQRYVRVYNLLKQELIKKLMTNCKWISSLSIHPLGDNLIIGGYDCKLCWFDLDLSNKPYKILRHHKKAIRQVAYHRAYPLFASCSDDGNIIVCHGTVYNDLLQNPLIVPVKVLKGHKISDEGVGVIDTVFHPTQPWIFSAGSDATIRLYT